MKKYIYVVALACLFSINSFAQKPFTAKVTGIVGGDTITVTTKDSHQIIIHLAGIDAPKQGQDFEMNARQSLSMAAFGETVSVADLKKDCLDHFSAQVILKNKDLSVWAIESGNAWADSSCQPDETLVKKETAAKENKVGLWHNPNAVRPSDYLKGKKEVVPVKTEPERRIYAGLAPVWKSRVPGLYINMTLADFIDECGEKGEKGKTYTSENYQHFSVDFPVTKENAAKGCDGSFSFQRSSSDQPYRLSSVVQ